MDNSCSCSGHFLGFCTVFFLLFGSALATRSGIGECSCASQESQFDDLRQLKTPVFTREPDDVDLWCPLPGEAAPVLRCETELRGAEGLRSPPLLVQWFHSGKKLKGKTGSILELSDPNGDFFVNTTMCLSLEGSYWCVVSIADRWNITSRKAQVTTHDFAEHSLSVKPAAIVRVTEGSTSVLRCALSGKSDTWPRQPGQVVRWDLMNHWGISVSSELAFGGGGCESRMVRAFASSSQLNRTLWACPLPDGSLALPGVRSELLNMTEVFCHLRVGEVPMMLQPAKATIYVLPATSKPPIDAALSGATVTPINISQRYRRSGRKLLSTPVRGQMNVTAGRLVMLYCMPTTGSTAVIRFWVNQSVCHDSGYTNESEWQTRRLTANILILRVFRSSVYPLTVTCRSGYGFGPTTVINETELFVRGRPTLQTSFTSVTVRAHCDGLLSSPHGTFCSGASEFVLPANVTLTCPVDYVHSMPLPCVRWLHNGLSVQQCTRSNELVLQMEASDDQLEVARKWRGLYQCVASNDFGEVQHTILVSVPGEPYTPVLFPSSEISRHLIYKKPYNGGSPGLHQNFHSLCYSCDEDSPSQGIYVSSCDVLGLEACASECYLANDCTKPCYLTSKSNTSASHCPNIDIPLDKLNLKTCTKSLHVCAQVKGSFGRDALSGYGPAVTLPLRAPYLISNVTYLLGSHPGLMVYPMDTTHLNTPIVNITVACQLCVDHSCDPPQNFSVSGNDYHRGYPVGIPFPERIRFGPYIQQKCTASAASLTGVTEGQTRMVWLKTSISAPGDAVEQPPSNLDMSTPTVDQRYYTYTMTWTMPPKREWNVFNLSAVVRYRRDNLTSDIFCSDGWQSTSLLRFLPGKTYLLSVAAVQASMCAGSRRITSLAGLKWKTKTVHTPEQPSQNSMSLGTKGANASVVAKQKVTINILWMVGGVLIGLAVSIVACMVYRHRHWKKGYTHLPSRSSSITPTPEIPSTERPALPGRIRQPPCANVVETASDCPYDKHPGSQFDKKDVDESVLSRLEEISSKLSSSKGLNKGRERLTKRSPSPVKQIDRFQQTSPKAVPKMPEGKEWCDTPKEISGPQPAQTAQPSSTVDFPAVRQGFSAQKQPTLSGSTGSSLSQSQLRGSMVTSPAVCSLTVQHAQQSQNASQPLQRPSPSNVPSSATVFHQAGDSTSAVELKELAALLEQPAWKLSPNDLGRLSWAGGDTGTVQLEFSLPAVMSSTGLLGNPGQPLVRSAQRPSAAPATDDIYQRPTGRSYGEVNLSGTAAAQQTHLQAAPSTARGDIQQAAPADSFTATASGLNLDLLGLRRNDTDSMQLDISQPYVTSLCMTTTKTPAAPAESLKPSFSSPQTTRQPIKPFPVLSEGLPRPVTSMTNQPLFPASFGSRVETSCSQAQLKMGQSSPPERCFLSSFSRPFIRTAKASTSADSGIDSPTYVCHNQLFYNDQSDSAEDDGSDMLSIEMQPQLRRPLRHEQSLAVLSPAKPHYTDTDYKASILESLLSSACGSDNSETHLLLPNPSNMRQDL